MKYCIHYHRNSPFHYFNEVDELEIHYRKEDVTLPDFLEQNNSKTVVITVENIEDIEAINRLSNLYTKYKNFKLKIDFADNELTKAAMDSGIPYFFSTFVDDWDTLTGIIKLHPTDIYIVNELGFELDKVAPIVHEQGIRVRAFPNVAQSTWKDTEDIKKFFIRPEDVDLYASYIDVFEFFGHEQQLSAYYSIYQHDKQWFGKLNEIINDFHSEIDNRCITPAFTKARLKCGKRCLKGHPCHICERVEHLANTLTDQKFILRVDKSS